MDVNESVDLTAANLKGLSHPLRIQVLGLLRTHGPATASALAARLGLNSGALSYHLRQLERYGFITEDPERGTARERWWRAAHANTRMSGLRDDPATAEAAAQMDELLAERIVARLYEAIDRRGHLTPEWLETFDMSDYLLRLTPTEARQLAADLEATMETYRRHEPGAAAPADSELVFVQYQLLPAPESAAPESAAPESETPGEAS